MSKRILYAIVYQHSVANIIRIEQHDSNSLALERIFQGSFADCESFALGLQEMSARIVVRHCDILGDILDHPNDWAEGQGDNLRHLKGNWRLRDAKQAGAI